MSRRFVAFAAAVLAPALALANGRPPLTNGVTFHPTDPHSLYVRSTFGLLISHDDGCSFHWVCEQAIGYGGEFDPKYAIAKDGTIFATTFKGLRVSRDGGCSWQTATEEIWVDALDIAPNGDVWIATAETAAASDVYRSKDNGATFEHRGMLSPTIWWKSVRVAATDSQRVYITGYQVAGPPLPDGGTPPPQAHFLRSDNGGDSWTPEPLAGVMYNATPIVLVRAVDPTNPDVLLMSSLGANGNGDRLYRSSDGGATFTEVLATTDTIRDVVFHNDQVLVATPAGSFVSRNNGATFETLAGAPQLACLGDHGGELIGCGANWQPDFMAVARTSDAAAWSKVFRFVELDGTLTCPPGTDSQTKCDPLYPALQEQFAATGPVCGALPDGPPEPPPAKHGGGCCDAGTSGTPLGALALSGLALVVVLRRRRR
jgi:hypothetical protein